MRRDLEHREQCAVIQFWSWACKGYGLPEHALMAYPAGGLRHKSTAGRLKAEGVRRGVPDLLLPVARQGFIGFAAEMKSEKGQVRDAQKIMHAWFQSLGWRVEVCFSAGEAIDALKHYLRA